MLGDDASILLVDNDESCRRQVAARLRDEGMKVREVESAGRALREVVHQRPDLLVLEWTLPDLPGVEVLQSVRADQRTAALRVLMTSRRGDAGDVVTALESGADDFLAEPYEVSELLARVRACLRRASTGSPEDTVAAGPVSINRVARRVSVAGTPVALAPREYRLLEFLLTHQDRVFSRQQLLAQVWERKSNVTTRTVDVHIRRLRKVLEPFGLQDYIQTVHGAGYRLSLKTL